MSTRQHGFSLLEVLVAFSILALSLGVVMQIFSGSLRNAEISRDQAQAVILAQSLLASTGVEARLAAGDSNGTLDNKFYWRIQVAPFQSSVMASGIPAPQQSAVLELWDVTVEVAWGGLRGDPKRTFVLSSLRVQPPTPQ